MRTCLDCRHLDAGFHSNIEDDSMLVWCSFRHWAPEWHANADDFRRMMAKATDCADFGRNRETRFDGLVGEALG